MNQEKLTFFYLPNDLHYTQNLFDTFLFKERERLTPVGRAFYVVNQKFDSEGSKTRLYDMENVTFFLNNNEDTINFNVCLFNKLVDNKFIPGTYKFQIIAGSGKYLGAKGVVTYVINEDTLRKVTVNIRY